MTYAEALAQYHLRPEAKFLYGEFCDRGRTERRHVVATQIVHIGKEANKWEESIFSARLKTRKLNMGPTKATVRWMRQSGKLARILGKGPRRAIWEFRERRCAGR